MDMITGKTRNLGVIGWPIGHSLSPVLQNAALTAAKLDYVYIALPVPPECLSAAVAGLRAANFSGWNVTIPHKEAIIHYLDEVEEAARAIGAVNTVVNRNGRLYGYNTDAEGFLGALLARGFDPAGKQVVLLGAGGAARAAAWALLKRGARSICIAVRNAKKGEAFVGSFRPYDTHGILHAEDWKDVAFSSTLAEAELVVNTTPIGMSPNISDMPPVELRQLTQEAFVYDIVYMPGETRFLREARALGHETLNGEDMLVLQGAAAFSLWTGEKPDIVLMKKELHAALLPRA